MEPLHVYEEHLLTIHRHVLAFYGLQFVKWTDIGQWLVFQMSFLNQYMSIPVIFMHSSFATVMYNLLATQHYPQSRVQNYEVAKLATLTSFTWWYQIHANCCRPKKNE